MLRGFLKNRSGNYAIGTAVALVPIMAAVGLAVDTSEILRQKGDVQNALDASCVAVGRRILDGASDSELMTYAEDFFNSNLQVVDPNEVTLNVVLPESDEGGGVLRMSAAANYRALVLPTLNAIIKRGRANTEVNFGFDTECDLRLKNTIEVALVLDNSGSMDYTGTGSTKKRIQLLKEAATYFVDEMTEQAASIQQLEKPIQFSIVPFAGSVNVGTGNAGASWMDNTGISPVHHENFDWSVMTSSNDPNKYMQKVGDIWYMRGTGWGTYKDLPMTRLRLIAQIQAETSRTRVGASYTYTKTQAYSWNGCVEERPYPYDIDDTAASTGTPSTMFVPWFYPDESGRVSQDFNHDGDSSDSTEGSASYNAYNSWWQDQSGSTHLQYQQDPRKYFRARAYGVSAFGKGPMDGCTTAAITPLTDTTTSAGLEDIKDKIDAMAPNGATNVPEGMAWGWRTLSSGEPFTEGRPSTQKGNDKVLIVLTDGDNTYYTPSSLGANDNPPNRSIYSSAGYVAKVTTGYSYTRMFQGTSNAISKTTYSNSNYTAAMNEHMAALCTNAKNAGMIIFTVGLDLPSNAPAISALNSCASYSRFRRDANGSYQKLFYNTKGGDLLEVFKKIAEELSNLRYVG